MRYGLERHNETLLRLGERWRTQLRAKADAGADKPADVAGPSGLDAASSSSLFDFWRYYSQIGPDGRIVDTERDG